MTAVVVVVGLALMVWLLARAGLFRAFARSAPSRKLDSSTRAIGGLPELPAALGFRPVFRYELLPALRALGEVPAEGRPEGIDDLAGCAVGTSGGRRVMLFSRASDHAGPGSVTAAVTTTRGDLPPVEIVPAGLPAPRRGSDAPVVTLDVEHFDVAYTVRSRDPDAVRTLVDGPMRRFLLSIVRPWSFSAGGGYAMVLGTDVDGTGVERLLEALDRFAEHVPAAVRARYPQPPTRLDEPGSTD